MSSLTVFELISELQHYPDNYEVIMDWKWLEDGERKHSIAMINGIERNDDFKEIRLLN